MLVPIGEQNYECKRHQGGMIFRWCTCVFSCFFLAKCKIRNELNLCCQIKIVKNPNCFLAKSWVGCLPSVSVFLRWALCQRSGLRYRCSSPELVCHPAVGSDCGSDRHSAGTLHVLVHSLLRLHLPVWDCFHGQDDPHSHAGQKLVLRSKLCVFYASFKNVHWPLGKKSFFASCNQPISLPVKVLVLPVHMLS